MEGKYTGILNEMQCLVVKNKNKEALIKIEYILELLKYEDKKIYKREFWCCYFHMSLINYRLEKYIESQNAASEALRYCNSKGDEIMVYWILALSQEKSNKDESLKLYNICLNYYNKNMIEYGYLLQNIARLEQNEEKMWQAINIYKEIQPENLTETLDDAYKDLIIHIYLNQYPINHIKIYQTLKEIKNENIRKEIRNKMLQSNL